MVELSILIMFAILCFAGLIFWALVIQPRAERAAGELTAADAWRISGLGHSSSQELTLYQIVPAPSLAKAEYRIQDEFGRDLGRYTGNGKKSATLEYGGKKATLYIQGGFLGGAEYAGKVGGSSNNSIVIRDDNGLIAEAWRVRIFPAAGYRCVYARDSFEITFGGIWATSQGSITHNREQIGAFRRPSASSRNRFLALPRNLSEELTVCLCSISLLQ
jgi:hypothetical protein